MTLLKEAPVETTERRHNTIDNIFLVKQVLVKSVVLIFCIFGLPTVLAGTWEVYRQGRPEVSIVYIGVYLSLLSCLIFRKKLSYLRQTAIVLLTLYVLALVTLARVGLSGAGLNLLITFIVLSTTFSGIKGSLRSVAANIATIFAVGKGLSYGWLPLDYMAMANNTIFFPGLNALHHDLQRPAQYPGIDPFHPGTPQQPGGQTGSPRPDE